LYEELCARLGDAVLSSGLLECPLSTRIEKVVDGGYAVMSERACADPIMSFQECYHAAAKTMAGSGPPRATGGAFR
jgi:hypothetical protein